MPLCLQLGLEICQRLSFSHDMVLKCLYHSPLKITIYDCSTVVEENFVNMHAVCTEDTPKNSSELPCLPSASVEAPFKFLHCGFRPKFDSVALSLFWLRESMVGLEVAAHWLLLIFLSISQCLFLSTAESKQVSFNEIYILVTHKVASSHF